jgi:Winged helix-turn helix
MSRRAAARRKCPRLESDACEQGQLYLKRWGFSAQKPLTRATQRDPQKIAAWLEQDYPSIAARAGPLASVNRQQI